jgi:hypothetical protein
MHKKGITEEVAKKRSRRTVKHQRGIVGADIAAIQARRNQTAAERLSSRQAAITKAKDEKKAKEAKKDKPKVRRSGLSGEDAHADERAGPEAVGGGTAGVEAGHEGHQGWPMSVLSLRPVYVHVSYSPCRWSHPCILFATRSPCFARTLSHIFVCFKPGF